MPTACVCHIEIDPDNPLEFVRSWSDQKGVHAKFQPVFKTTPNCAGAGCEKDLRYLWEMTPAIAGTAVIDGAADAPTLTVKHEAGTSANIKIKIQVAVTVTCSMVFKVPGDPVVVIKRHKTTTGADDTILF